MSCKVLVMRGLGAAAARGTEEKGPRGLPPLVGVGEDPPPPAGGGDKLVMC